LTPLSHLFPQIRRRLAVLTICSIDPTWFFHNEGPSPWIWWGSGLVDRWGFYSLGIWFLCFLLVFSAGLFVSLTSVSIKSFFSFCFFISSI
jgi:hypothetical protein